MIEKIHFSLFNATNVSQFFYTFSRTSCKHTRRRCNSMLLNFNTINDFILAFCDLFLSIIMISVIKIFFIILRHGRKHKFKVSPIQLQIHQLVDQLAYNLSTTHSQLFYLYVIDVRQTKLFQVVHHFVQSVVQLTLVVFEVDEDALFFVLNTSCIRNMNNLNKS